MYDYQQNSNISGIKRLVILLDNEKGFLKQIKFAHKACQVSYSENLSVFGKLYAASIVARIPMLNSSFYEFMKLNGEAQWICLAEDFNNYLHIIGTQGAGAVMVVSGVTSPANGYELTFAANSPYPFEIKQSKIMQSIQSHKIIDLRKAAEVDIYLDNGSAFDNEFTLYDAEGDVIDLQGGFFDLEIYKNGTIVKSYSLGYGLGLINNNSAIAMISKFNLGIGMYDYKLWQNKGGASPQLLMKGLWIVT